MAIENPNGEFGDEIEMPEKYTFVYQGELKEDTKPTIKRCDSGLVVINLYRESSRRHEFSLVVVDFPFPNRPLEQQKFCSSFIDLMRLIEEKEAMERQNTGQIKREDELLIFSRMLRNLQAEEKIFFTGIEPDICQGVRNLRLRSWEYNIMGVWMRSRTPLPYYDCVECGDSDYAENYGLMERQAIAYIATKAARFRDFHIINNLAFPYGYLTTPEGIDRMFNFSPPQRG